MSVMIDVPELIKRAIKYLVEGLAVAVVAIIIPKKPLNVEEIVIIALTAAAAFSILDVFIPSVGAAARNGAGFSFGVGLTGGLPLVA